MTRRQAQKANIRQLVAEYVTSAGKHGAATEASDYKTANKAANVVAIVYAELRSRGETAQSALLPLLADADPWVRLWAASHALEFRPRDAEPVLRALSSASHFLGLDAKTTLDEWRAGRLRFP